MKRYSLLPLVLSISLGLTGCMAASAPAPADAPAEVASVETEENDAAEEAAEDAAEEDGVKDKLSKGNGDGKEEAEMEQFTIDDDSEPVDKSEKTATNEMTRGVDFGRSYTESDIEGYWQYDDFDSVYFALYDTGEYETYDSQTDELLTDGIFTIDGAEVTMTERGGASETILMIANLHTLIDDEGDVLSPYRPKFLSSSSDGSNARAGYEGDVVIEELDDGYEKIKTTSKGVFIKYPSFFNAAGGTGEYLWVDDGENGFLTARNVTDEYYDFAGSDEEFVRQVATKFLVSDFMDIYGDPANTADARYKSGSGNWLGSITGNIWNDDVDIYVYTKVYLSPYSDGTFEAVLINGFYPYGSNEGRTNLEMCSIGGMR